VRADQKDGKALKACVRLPRRTGLSAEWNLQPGVMLSKAEFRGQRNEDASKHPEDECVTMAASGNSHKDFSGLRTCGNFTRSWL
jgi:hypothetical protein